MDATLDAVEIFNTRYCPLIQAAQQAVEGSIMTTFNGTVSEDLVDVGLEDLLSKRLAYLHQEPDAGLTALATSATISFTTNVESVENDFINACSFVSTPTVSTVELHGGGMDKWATSFDCLIDDLTSEAESIIQALNSCGAKHDPALLVELCVWGCGS